MDDDALTPEILFFRWVNLTEQRWVIFRERRSTTFDISLGKTLSEGKYRISVTALNVANRHVLLDNSLTFGGFHYNDPRQIYAEFRWRFHY